MILDLEQIAHAARPLTDIPERECVASLAAEVPSRGLILEIGCLYGGMTAVMALANPAARVIAIDDFSWHPSDDVPTSKELLLANMLAAGARNVECIQGDSRVLGKIWNQPIDLLWIDGGHAFEYVFADLMNFGRHSRVIACHDFDNPSWPSIRQAVNEFMLGTTWQIAQVAGTVVVLKRG